ncbi:MAG: exo-alpha-sialidase, partial [Planctomycetota bacterium]
LGLSPKATAFTYNATDPQVIRFEKNREVAEGAPELEQSVAAWKSNQPHVASRVAFSDEDLSVLVYPADAQHPRYTEGSIVELEDGSLLFAITEFMGGGSDFSQARIVGRRSSDGGRTWSQPEVLQENTGKQNVMSVTLRRIDRDDGASELAMFYLEKNGFDDLQMLVRFSSDQGRSFGPPVRVTTDPGYHVVNNDRVTILSSGRWIVPAASTRDVRQENHFVSRCYISDDRGRTWRPGRGRVDAPRRGAMEPDVVELKDGRLLMIIRTQLGYIGRSYSSDGGDTWSPMESMGIQAPEAPATIRRIPATGDLMLIWNNTYSPEADHGGRRTPLVAAVSTDEGQSWRIAGELESDPARTYSYPSLTFAGSRVLLSYWESGAQSGWLSTRFRSLPLGWFYRHEAE